MNIKNYILSLFCLAATLSVEAKGGSELSKEQMANLPIREIVEQLYPKNLYVGIATHGQIKGERSFAHDSERMQIVDREFNYITPANDFKQSYIVSEPGKWKWTLCDEWLKHLKANGQIMRAHSPISPQVSKWVKEDHRTAEELSSMLDEFFITFCKRYNDEELIVWLDVVNEIFIEKRQKDDLYGVREAGDWFGPREGTSQWENPWVEMGYHLGKKLNVPIYIDRAFEISNKYAPNKIQIINQHGDFDPIVWDQMKDLVSYLRDERGRRVDGLGWQAHVDVGWEYESGNLKYLDDYIKWCHQNGLEFHITELNVWRGKDKSKSYEKEQAKTYRAIMDVMLKHVETGVIGINFWQVRPAESANREDEGSMWRDDYTPTPAYDAVKEALINNAGKKVKTKK